MLVPTLAALDGCLVLTLFRVLHLHPAPAFRRGSLRAEARKLLAPKSRRERWARRAGEIRLEHPFLDAIPYLAIFAFLFLPVPLQALGIDTSELSVGPFRSAHRSEEFLQTLWQVVAAAVGLTVAMLAFAFEAFIGSEQRQFGSSLRAYARETGVLAIVRLGVSALLLNGAVLLGIGEEAPGGWAGMWATAIAAVTLFGVLVVIQATIKSLAPIQLTRIRREQLDRVVSLALRRQLLTQAADAILRQGGAQLVALAIAPTGGERLRADVSGELRDIRLGTLRRIAVRSGTSAAPVRLHTLVRLDEEIDDNTEVAIVPNQLSPRSRRAMRRAFRIERGSGDPEQADLVSQIDRLHGAAKAAIRSAQASEWREIGRLYERILLALPKEAASLGLPFEGAIAAPGIFGFGPMQRIQGNLMRELETAVEMNDSELVEAIVYVPYSVAHEAARLGAYSIVAAMLALYPRMYRLARRRET